MHTIVIEKNVPPSSATNGRAGYIRPAMRAMEIGDSFLMPEGLKSVRAQAYAAATAVGIKITTSFDKESNRLRVWRSE